MTRFAIFTYESFHHALGILTKSSELKGILQDGNVTRYSIENPIQIHFEI
jgi:hypothetical protein